jgi:hypothetical protein
MMDNAEKYGVIGTIFGIFWTTITYAIAKGPK